MTDTLKQRQYLNYSVREMIVLLTVSQSELVDKIPEKKMTAYNEGLLDYIHANHEELLEKIDPDKKTDDALRAEILSIAEDYVNCSVGEDSHQAQSDAEAEAEDAEISSDVK